MQAVRELRNCLAVTEHLLTDVQMGVTARILTDRIHRLEIRLATLTNDSMIAGFKTYARTTDRHVA